jgi:hypothetical protein
MLSQAYEITFKGQAGTTLRAEFDDCTVTVGSCMTTLRTDLPDQCALAGLVQRITGLGLEVVHLHLVGPATPTMTDLPQARAQDPAAAGLPEEPGCGGWLNHEYITSSCCPPCRSSAVEPGEVSHATLI